jgi:hypothetical protein
MTQAEGEFDPRPSHEGFVADKLAMGEMLLRTLRSSSVSVTPSLSSHLTPTMRLHKLSNRQHFSLSPRLSGLFGWRQKLISQYEAGLCKPLLRYIASV